MHPPRDLGARLGEPIRRPLDVAGREVEHRAEDFVVERDGLVSHVSGEQLDVSIFAADGVEETVVDGVLLLSATAEGLERHRYLEVYKLRNTAHLKGRHNLTIGAGGLQAGGAAPGLLRFPGRDVGGVLLARVPER